MTETIEKLGKLIDAGEGRDAIHIAVVPVTSVSEQVLLPGWPVVFASENDREHVRGTVEDTGVGVVDPYLRSGVRKGERFWMFLYPATITSLRHVWTHPAFPEVPAASPVATADKKVTSAAWLDEWLNRHGDNPGYDAVMQTIRDGSWNDGEYNSGRLEPEFLHFSGTDAHGEIPAEFWEHVEVVLGHKPKHRPTFFSCSC